MKINVPQKNLSESNFIDLDQNLLNWIRDQGLPLASSCAGQGVCGTCQIFIIPEPPFSESEIKVLKAHGLENKLTSRGAVRIACQIRIRDLLAQGPSKTWEVFSDSW